MKQHLLQLYDDADFMVERVVSFLRQGAQAGESLVVIATPTHGAAVASGLQGCSERLVVRDAQEMLDEIMRGDRVESRLFERHVGGLFETASAGGRHVRGFGEMVALLWEEGNQDAAVRLERLWSRLSGSQRYSLMCAYPLSSLEDVHHAPFMAICDGHSQVFAKEHKVPDELKLRVQVLEREAGALRAELSRRLDVQHVLSQADETKDDFIAILAHELRNPLTPILAAVEMFKKTSTPQQQQRLVETIGRQTTVLSRLVEDLLEARRITSGHISMASQNLQLRALLDQAAETSGQRMEERGQTLWVECPPDVHVLGDEVRLIQAIVNLLNNASKFTPSGGTISLTAYEQAGTVRIEVRDNGCGMDPEFLDRAFDAYSQATVGEGGLGLGLAIVRSIVRMHDGTIEAESAGPGAGTTFAITLPQKDAEAPRPKASLGPTSGSSRVLVVDDNVDVRDTLAALLEAYGHQARTAASGQEALEQMRHGPHVVLLDLGMPEMDGFEVARRLRRMATPPVIVALSGHGGHEVAGAGFDHHFTKPPDMDRLLRVVASAQRQRGGPDREVPAG